MSLTQRKGRQEMCRLYLHCFFYLQKCMGGTKRLAQVNMDEYYNFNGQWRGKMYYSANCKRAWEVSFLGFFLWESLQGTVFIELSSVNSWHTFMIFEQYFFQWKLSSRKKIPLICIISYLLLISILSSSSVLSLILHKVKNGEA